MVGCEYKFPGVPTVPLVDCTIANTGLSHQKIITAYTLKAASLHSQIAMFDSLIEELKVKHAAALLRLAAEKHAAKGSRTSTKALTNNGLVAAESALAQFRKNAYKGGAWGDEHESMSIDFIDPVDVTHGHPVLNHREIPETVDIPMISTKPVHVHVEPEVEFEEDTGDASKW